MRADVLARAVDHIAGTPLDAPLLCDDAARTPLDQALVRELAAGPGVSVLRAFRGH